MKYIAFLCICVGSILLSSCSNSTEKTEESANVKTELTDSLQTVNAEKDSLLGLLNEISSGMAQIKDIEQLITGDLSKETPDRKDQIRTDMMIIQQSMLDRRKKLETLEAKLKKSTNFNSEMQRTIKSLRYQIETQENAILELQESLKNAHIEIEDLNLRVDSLQQENNAVNQEKLAAKEESVQLANQLNTCYYVIGSKSELKKYNIIETGFLRKTKIMEGDFEKSYFTKADKRTLSSINLHSLKAKVLSNHPNESYRIVQKNGTKVLDITNPAKFWDLSNYLIVQTD